MVDGTDQGGLMLTEQLEVVRVSVRSRDRVGSIIFLPTTVCQVIVSWYKTKMKTR